MKKWDVVIIVFLIIVSVLPITLIFNKNDDYNKKEVLISVNGKEHSRFLLSDEEREIEIENGNKKSVIYIRDDSVVMKYTECPDKICIRRGEIKRVGDSIVCLPNKILIEIIGYLEDDIIMSH